MSIVTIPFVKPGDIVNLTDYTLETMPVLQSQKIEAENVRTEAYHKPHIFGDSPSTILFTTGNDTETKSTPTYLSSGSFAQLYAHEIVLPSVLMKENNVLRLHTTLNIKDYNTIGGNKGEFEFAYYWDVGAGYVRIPDSPAYRYGAAPLDREGPSPWAPRENWRVGFSYCKPLTANVTVTKVAVFYRWIDTWDFWIDFSTTTLLHFRS